MCTRLSTLSYTPSEFENEINGHLIFEGTRKNKWGCRKCNYSELIPSSLFLIALLRVFSIFKIKYKCSFSSCIGKRRTGQKLKMQKKMKIIGDAPKGDAVKPQFAATL